MQYILGTFSKCSALFSCFKIKNLSQVSAHRQNKVVCVFSIVIESGFHTGSIETTTIGKTRPTIKMFKNVKSHLKYLIKVLMEIISKLWLPQNILIIMLGLQIIVPNRSRLDAIRRMNVGLKLKCLIL